MAKEEKIDLILDDLVKNGSDKKEIEKLRLKCVELLKYDRSYNEIFDEIAMQTSWETEDFLWDTNKLGEEYLQGISSTIFLGSDNYLNILDGYRDQNKNDDIDETTLFDVASITKLFTLILAYECETLGLDLNIPVKALSNDYDLGDFTINDLIRMCGEIATSGRINDAKSPEEAYQILKSAHLVSSNRKENKYTDIGAMVIGDILVKILNGTRAKNYDLNEWMRELIFKPLNMNNTTFNPTSTNITGCGNRLEVHDPKAQALGGVAGHAGIFTNGKDLAKLANGLFRVYHHQNRPFELTKEHIYKMGEITFPNAKQCNKGNLGLYVKHPDGFARTFTPSVFATGSFSHQGWTGSLATFDPVNQIHQSILVNTIYDTDDKELVRNDKPLGFGGRFDQYLDQFTTNTMLLFIAKKYYDKYINEQDNISYTNKIR